MEKKFYVGQKVRFVEAEGSNYGHESHPQWFPVVGTVGEVAEITDYDCLVKWPDNSTSGSDTWWTLHENLILAFESGQMVRLKSGIADKTDFDGGKFTYYASVFGSIVGKVGRVSQIYKNMVEVYGLVPESYTTLQDCAWYYPMDALEIVEDEPKPTTPRGTTAESRKQGHAYYARCSFRSPSCASLVRVTTRSALVAARELNNGAETIEIQSLHGRVLDIARKSDSGKYNRV